VGDVQLKVCTLISVPLDTSVWVQFLENFCPLHGFLKMEHIYALALKQYARKMLEGLGLY
jgi:hypothetical protein